MIDTAAPVSGQPRLTEPRAERVPGSTASPMVSWPIPPAEEAFRGLAGDVVATLRGHTEADDVALLISFLEVVGCAIGPGPHVYVGEARHGVNLFAVAVGDTSRARKGHAWASTRGLVLEADRTMAEQIVTGLSTGEGLIERVRDGIEVREWNKQTNTYDTRIDPGRDDKRLLAVETEMARTLEVARRDGNTLSHILRQAWDGDPLDVLTRKSPIRATGAHISVFGHITTEELRRRLDDVSIANGFANRFMWLPVRRARQLARPEPLLEADRAPLVARIRAVLDAAHGRGRLDFDPEAEAAWDAAYPALTADHPGLAGAMTARAEAHARRLALEYALLDSDHAIRAPHIFAALALVEYADRGVAYLFGDRLGDGTADTILESVRRRGKVTRSEVRDIFHHHVSSSRLDVAIAGLVASGAINVEEESTSGRPVTVLTLGTKR